MGGRSGNSTIHDAPHIDSTPPLQLTERYVTHISYNFINYLQKRTLIYVFLSGVVRRSRKYPWGISESRSSQKCTSQDRPGDPSQTQPRQKFQSCFEVRQAVTTLHSTRSARGTTRRFSEPSTDRQDSRKARKLPIYTDDEDTPIQPRRRSAGSRVIPKFDRPQFRSTPLH